jgi:hypothetical protein
MNEWDMDVIDENDDPRVVFFKKLNSTSNDNTNDDNDKPKKGAAASYRVGAKAHHGNTTIIIPLINRWTITIVMLYLS